MPRSRARSWGTLATLAALTALLGRAAAGEPGPAERQGLARVADVWVDLARWCLDRELGAAARACVERARGAQPVPEELARAAADCPDAGREADQQRLRKREASAAKQAAGLWDRLAALAAQEGAPDRAARYRLDAFETEASPRRLGALIDALEARAKDDPAGVAALAARALAREPDEPGRSRLVAVADLAAVAAPVLRAARGHPMRYWLSLPSGFRRGAGPWPVLVAVDGAGSNFEGIARAYAGARGEWPFVIVSPCTFSNTNAIAGDLRARYERIYSAAEVDAALRDRLTFDEAGLLAVLEEVTADLGGAPRACMTGFSGGGFLTYRMVLRQPGRLAAAAPACANFSPSVAGDLSGDPPPEVERLPVHILTGADDPHRTHTFGDPNQPGIEPQTDAAVALLERRGYRAVQRTLVPGLKHDPATRLVLDALRAWLEKR